MKNKNNKKIAKKVIKNNTKKEVKKINKTKNNEKESNNKLKKQNSILTIPKKNSTNNKNISKINSKINNEENDNRKLLPKNNQPNKNSKNDENLVTSSNNEGGEVINNKILTKNNQFKIDEFVVYPAHGVGKIIAINPIKIGDSEKLFYFINFEKEKLSIHIPLDNYQSSGLRPISSKSQIDEVLTILRSGIKKLKGMWSRRAQEYETKINSGSILQLAEVIRDLTRDIDDNERSYSERVIYETAIYRLSSEYGAIFKISFEDAKNKILAIARDKLEVEYKENRKNNEFDDFDFDEFEKKNNKRFENNEDDILDENNDDFEDDDFEDDEDDEDDDYDIDDDVNEDDEEEDNND